jgi:hypothetical protein
MEDAIKTVEQMSPEEKAKLRAGGGKMDSIEPWGDNIEDDDPGPAPEAIEEICECLLGTHHTINEVICNQFDWICSHDLVAAVRARIVPCLDCGRWIDAEWVRCANCIKKHASSMTENNDPRWRLTGDDIAFLRACGVGKAVKKLHKKRN